jgi:hypothetical protein
MYASGRDLRLNPACGTCGSVARDGIINVDSLPLVGVIIQRNGIKQVVRYCDGCQAQQNVKKHGHDVGNLPVIRDNRRGCCDGHGCPTCSIVSCEHCGSYRDLQLHHWAPWALFGAECNEWPTSWLCQPCHALWHKTVTPNMRRTA